MTAIVWTIGKLQQEANKYTSRSDFRKYSKNAYLAANKKKLLDIICTYTETKYVYWTNTMLQKEALKYNTRNDFQKYNSNAYQSARKKGILKEICSHMDNDKINWTIEMLKKEALKYNTRTEFAKKSQNAYATAVRRNIINDICCHMEWHNGMLWTEDALNAEAAKYKSIKEFRKNNEAAYTAIKRKKLISTACSHMSRGQSGFNPAIPAILYYIKFESILDTPIYKIGITNYNTKERINSMLSDRNVTATILKEFYFEIGKEAYELEQLYHKEFENYRYNGDSFLKNGNTELFYKDVLNLDTAND